MTIYILTLLVSSGFFLIAGNKRVLQKYALILSMALLWAVASFRSYSVGLDTIPYKDFFDSVVAGDSAPTPGLLDIFTLTGFENGYKLLNQAVSLLSDNFTVLLMVAHLVILMPITILIRKHSKNYSLSYAIYFSLFFLASMNHLRQAIAISIVLLGVNFIIQRKFIKYLVIVLLATLVHQSAIIMLIPYFIYGKRISTRGVVYILLATLIAFIAIEPIVQIMAANNFRYETYLSKLNSFNLGSFIVTGFLGTLALITVKFGSLAKKTLHIKSKIVLIDFYTYLSIAAFAISALSIKFSGIDRLANYFLIYTIIGLPMVIKSSGVRQQQTINITLSILLVGYAIALLLLRPEWLGVTIYQTIFST